jgi:hypothetical protein
MFHAIICFVVASSRTHGCFLFFFFEKKPSRKHPNLRMQLLSKKSFRNILKRERRKSVVYTAAKKLPGATDIRRVPDCFWQEKCPSHERRLLVGTSAAWSSPRCVFDNMLLQNAPLLRKEGAGTCASHLEFLESF